MPLRSFNWGTDASCNDLKGGDRGGGAIMDVKTLCLGVFTLGKLLAPDKFQSKIRSLSFFSRDDAGRPIGNGLRNLPKALLKHSGCRREVALRWDSTRIYVRAPWGTYVLQDNGRLDGTTS